jgi:non-ribosomal peptide synthetase-like protein
MELTLHELFESQVDLHPESIAIITPGAEGNPDLILSYRELDELCNQWARWLIDQGLGPEQFVGIYFERSFRPIVAILACLKAGAAYVPIDPAYPADRIRSILEESGAKLFLTENSLLAKAQSCFDGPVFTYASIYASLEAEVERRSTRVSRLESGVSPKDLCYVIYTSGTTGRPKGIMVEHRNVVKFVAAFNEVCATEAQDRVFQGFSLTFDGSVEEIWMAFSNGSTLVVPDKETPKFGNELGQYLAQNGVTYFSTVPTLLSTFTDPVQSLRLLVVSGEICPLDLVNRWAKPGLRMFNVYGPTEATVNTTAFECIPGKTVTIGKPLRGYGIQILDEKLLPVAKGQKGELFVCGDTLARGYLNQPAMTDEKFFSLPEGRLYRSGDLVRWNEENELEFFGRIDSQVKIRGYRVELAEIESVLLELPEIRSVSVKLFEKDGLQELAAYVVLRNSSQELDRDALLSQLEVRLPSYMIPGFLDVLPSFPTLTSGKTDRSKLPLPQKPWLRQGTTIVKPETTLETTIAAVWAKTFSVAEVSVEDDFFLHLGGHSLIAAQMVTFLRRETQKHVAVRDVYTYPTVRLLAQQLDTLVDWAPIEPDKTIGAQAVFQSTPRLTRVATAALQLISMYLLYGIAALPLALIFIQALHCLDGAESLVYWIIYALTVSILTWPTLLLLSIASKWILVGRYKPGSHPLWGMQFFRHWLAGRFQAFSGAGALVGTPLLPLYFRAMGAKIGKRCTFDTASCGAWDLVSIGDDTSIGADTQLLGYHVENGLLTIGSIQIGSRCFIGIHSALGIDSKMEDDSRLDDQSLLPQNQVLKRGISYRGSPAEAGEVLVAEAAAQKRNPILWGAVQLLLIHLMPLLGLIPLAPFLALWYLEFSDGRILVGSLLMIVSVPMGVVVTALYIVALKKLILGSAKPGTYKIDSFFYVRKWLSDGIMKAARVILLPLYTTLYFPPWLRMLGAKIGARAELSTVWNFAPELVDVGEESFFADGSIIGGKRFFGGRFTIGLNKIGRRSFVGNSAILPVGKSLGDRCLLGVQSIPPADGACTADGTEWLGSPSFSLPRRLVVGGFDNSTTFKPTRKLYIQRAIIDACRIFIPGYILLSAATIGVFAMYWSFVQWGTFRMFAVAPLISLALAFYAIFCVVALKKMVMGTFKPVIVPLWSMYVWLNEMINGAYESVMTPAIMPFLGTPFVGPLLRLIGCKIGKHCYIESTLFSEWDLVEVGDYAALNAGAIIQTHLFEDRIMKSSYLKVGSETSIGNMAVALYDTEMKTGSSLGPLSLLMKGETLAPHTKWHGIPTVQVKPPADLAKVEAIPGLRRKTPVRAMQEQVSSLVASLF